MIINFFYVIIKKIVGVCSMKDKDISFKIILFILIILLVLGFVFGIYVLFKKDFKIKNFNKEINIEYNEKFKNMQGYICYGNIIKCNNPRCITSEERELEHVFNFI